MVTPTRGALRLARAVVVAGIVVALAGFAHVLGGGSLPPVGVDAALAAIVLAVTVGLTGWRLGWVGSLLVLGIGQFALHGAFSVFQTSGCASLVPAGTHAHMDHAAHLAFLQSSGCSGAGMSAVVGALGAWAMTAAHVVATLVAALAVTGFDRALWWLAAWLRPLVGPVTVPDVPARAQLPVALDQESFSRQAWRSTVPLRGPPSWEHPVSTAF